MIDQVLAWLTALILVPVLVGLVLYAWISLVYRHHRRRTPWKYREMGRRLAMLRAILSRQDDASQEGLRLILDADRKADTEYRNEALWW